MAHLKDAYNPAVPLAVAIAYAVRHPARASATGGVSPGRPAVCLATICQLPLRFIHTFVMHKSPFPRRHAIARDGRVALSAHLKIVFIVSPDHGFLGGLAYLSHHGRFVNADANWRSMPAKDLDGERLVRGHPGLPA